MANWQSRARNALKKSGYTLPEDKEYTATGSDGKTYSVSYGLMKAVEGNGINSYSPKNDGEKRVLENYKKLRSEREKANKATNMANTSDNKKDNKKAGFLSWLGKAGMDGINQFNSSLFKAIDFIVPDVFGKNNQYDPIKKASNYYSSTYEKGHEGMLQASASRGKGWTTAAQLVSGTINQIPQALLAIMTAGIGEATALGTSGAGALSAAAEADIISSGSASAKTLGKYTTAAAQAMLKNPQFWTSFMTTAGDEYEDTVNSMIEQKQKKTNNKNAALDTKEQLAASCTALMSALINSGIEIGGGIEQLPKKLVNAEKGTVKNTIKDWVLSSLDEGKEEVVQGIISQGMQKLVSNNDNKLVSLTDDNAVISGSRAAQEFGMGAAIGAIAGGAQIGANSGANVLANAAY
ncbi:MAG: hypothetical protein ACI4EA_04520, partial [Candidatus Ornithomonoglobus sp.]